MREQKKEKENCRERESEVENQPGTLNGNGYFYSLYFPKRWESVIYNGGGSGGRGQAYQFGEGEGVKA